MWDATLAERYLGEHLPRAGLLAAKGIRPSAALEPRVCFSKPSAQRAYQVAADVATRGR